MFKRIVINSFFTTLTILSIVNVVYSSEADHTDWFAKYMLELCAKEAYQQDSKDIAAGSPEASLRFLMHFDSKMQPMNKDEQFEEEYAKNRDNFLEELEKIKKEFEETSFDLDKSTKLMEKIFFQNPDHMLVRRLISSPVEEQTFSRTFNNPCPKEEVLRCVDGYIRYLKEEDSASNFDKVRVLLSRFRSFFPIGDEEQFTKKVESWTPRTSEDFLRAEEISSNLFLMIRQNGVLMSNDDIMNLPEKKLAGLLGLYFHLEVETTTESCGSIGADLPADNVEENTE